MAAIAKFVSYDGGIAFSDSVLKIQKRDEERGRLIPIDSIAGLEVDEPLLGGDGCIRVRIGGKKPSLQDVIFFEDDQYDEALQFKSAFDSFMGQAAPELPPLEMFQPTAIASRPRRTQARYTEQESPRQRQPVRQTGRRRRSAWWYALAAVLVIGVIANIGGRDEKEQQKDETVIYAAAEPTTTTEPTAAPTVEPTAEPTPEATPFVGYTSPPMVTSPPVQAQAPATQQPQAGTTYVLNTSTMKFHNPLCHDVGKINAANRQDYTGTRDEVIAKGYSPCGHCHP